jgi:hypothetical protein
MQTHVWSRSTATVEGSVRGLIPNPPCQYSLWEETGTPGENPRLWALSINTTRRVRTVKLLNETQNVWASDLSDRKILIQLEWGPFSLDIWETYTGSFHWYREKNLGLTGQAIKWIAPIPVGCWLTLFTNKCHENQTHDLRGAWVRLQFLASLRTDSHCRILWWKKLPTCKLAYE